MSMKLLTSIAPLLLLVGVALPSYIPYHQEISGLHPIVSRSQEHRICAELCMTGLGGEPCGTDCMDLTPQGLPLQSLNETATGKFGVSTRHGACSVLCQNGLGDPLCHCDRLASSAMASKKTDFVQVCALFCVEFDYQIYGCQECQLYKTATESRLIAVTANMETDGGEVEPMVDWDLWCQSMCQEGDGGAACNCDLLPMSLQV